MEQWSSVGSQLRDNANSILSFALLRLDNCLIVTLPQFFIVALMGTYQQARGQVSGVWGDKLHF